MEHTSQTSEGKSSYYSRARQRQAEETRQPILCFSPVMDETSLKLDAQSCLSMYLG